MNAEERNNLIEEASGQVPPSSEEARALFYPDVPAPAAVFQYPQHDGDEKPFDQDPNRFQKKALYLVRQWYEDNINGAPEDVYVVWFSKTLQNWKALISSNLDDFRYFELTYNGDKQETYLDVYIKESNEVVLDSDLA